MYSFNFKSNIHFVFKSKGEIYNYETKNQKVLYENEDVLIREVNLRRRNNTIINKVVNFLSRPKLFFFETKKNKNNFFVEYHEKGATAASNLDDEIIFSVNSSFYDSQFEPNGLIIVNGIRYGDSSKSTGHFKVINGMAIAGPTSMFGHNQDVIYSCQSHPSVMKNGVIWDYILNESKNEKYWKSKTYRSLVGQNKQGNVCFLLSGNGGLLSIKEITQIARATNIQTATCLDAGAALQYAYEDDGFKIGFSSMNNKISLGLTVDKIFMKLVGKRFYSESPAYINYRS